MEATKIKDNLFYDERSAGGIVFKEEGGKTLWLLIRTALRSNIKQGEQKKKGLKTIYKFPKGHLQKGEFLKQAALREVEEEGRVKAKILTKIGSNNYIIFDKLRKKKIIKKVTFFLMKYEEQSNLKYYDREIVLAREWMDYDGACNSLAYDSEKILLRKAKERLENIKGRMKGKI